MHEVRAIEEAELERWVAVDEETGTVEDYVDWRRQAQKIVWLLASDNGRDVAAGIGVAGWHEPRGVARGEVRGIAGALKRAEIAWAKRNGYTRLKTANEERNEPIRRLNQRHGYVPALGHVIVRGPIAADN